MAGSESSCVGSVLVCPSRGLRHQSTHSQFNYSVPSRGRLEIQIFFAYDEGRLATQSLVGSQGSGDREILVPTNYHGTTPCAVPSTTGLAARLATQATMHHRSAKRRHAALPLLLMTAHCHRRSPNPCMTAMMLAGSKGGEGQVFEQ